MAAVASADISKLAEALRTSGQQAQATTAQVLNEAANYILSEMQSRCPVDSGNLRESLGIRVEQDKVIIGPDMAKAPYAPYVIFGTGPHTIRPKEKNGVLAFSIGGQQVFAKVVHHPGTKAQPFVQEAFDAWVDSLGTMVAEANIKVIEREAS